MTKTYKVLYRDPDGCLRSFATTGVLACEFFRNRETTGWSGTPCLVFDSFKHARMFVGKRPKGSCEIWKGDAREVVPLPSGHLGPPNVLCDGRAYWKFLNEPIDNTAGTYPKSWPAGTLAVRGFTPRRKVWSNKKQQ